MNHQVADYKLAEPYLSYVSRIRDCFPDLALSQIEAPAEGLVNSVIIINRERVFRFPKTDRARETLRKEAKILDLAAKYIDMRLPVFDYRQADFVSYPFIPGDVLHREDILRQDDAIQDRLAGQLALFLRQLHTIPPQELEQHDIPPSEAVRSLDDYVRMFEAVRQELFPLLWSDGKEWVARHFEPVLANPDWLAYRPALINGDLSSYHIRYDRAERKINSVIDFGTAGVGDPANDFAAIINNYGETFLRRMVKFYPEIKDAVERARFMAGVLELEWVLGGIRSKDLSLFTVHLGRARDVMPLGSGWPARMDSSDERIENVLIRLSE